MCQLIIRRTWLILGRFLFLGWTLDALEEVLCPEVATLLIQKRPEWLLIREAPHGPNATLLGLAWRP